MVYICRALAWSGLGAGRAALVHNHNRHTLGRTVLQFAKLLFCPFGKDVRFGGGLGSLILNIIWLCVSGLPLCVEAVLIGCILCITIVGIPFGKQCFKYAKLALMPFGADIVKT